jgi:hypothetical protein
MRAAAAILAVILLAQQGTIFAQTPPGRSAGAWGDVKALPIGGDLTIKLKDGRSVKGKLITARDSDLVVKVGKNDAVLDRESILQIHRRVPKSRKRAVAIGAAVGGGLGGVAGGASPDGAGDLSQPASTIMSAVAFAGVGALVGWAVGGGNKQVLIYQAEK